MLVVDLVDPLRAYFFLMTDEMMNAVSARAPCSTALLRSIRPGLTRSLRSLHGNHDRCPSLILVDLALRLDQEVPIVFEDEPGDEARFVARRRGRLVRQEIGVGQVSRHRGGCSFSSMVAGSLLGV